MLGTMSAVVGSRTASRRFRRAKRLLARGQMRLDASQRPPRLFSTEHGLSALRAMMRNRRLADPTKFAHVRRELGIDPAPEDKATD